MTEKVVSELCLLPEGTAALQAFMDAHFMALQHNDPGARHKLRDLLMHPDGSLGVLPREVCDTLHQILINRSDIALLIHGLPERTGFDKIKHEANDTYAFHIGREIYELFGAESTHTVLAQNDARKDKRLKSITNFPHRDMLGDFIIFSCALNTEHALTEVIALKRAIGKLSPALRERVRVSLAGQDSQLNDYNYTLADVWQVLNYRPESARWLRIMKLESTDLEPATREFLKVLGECSKAIDLQPGSLLVLAEDAMFHCGVHRAIKNIADIPPDALYSRSRLHHAARHVAATAR